MLHHSVPILWFDSGLEKVCEDLREYARNSLSSKLVAVISSECDSVMIEGINKNITRLLELFWASHFMLSKAPYILSVIVICTAGEPYRRDHYTTRHIERRGEARYIDARPLAAGSDAAGGHHRNCE